MDKVERSKAVHAAIGDRASQTARVHLCQVLAPAFRKAGEALWLGGSLFGDDRVSGESPFGHGSDATVGLATVAQVAGELTSGTVTLLERDNLYAGAALLRQMVEVEYLAWAFSEDKDEAASWLRSSREGRLKLWQPRHMRKRSEGRFRGGDYAAHCDVGGHPTPHAVELLPGHSARRPVGLYWFDLAAHGSSTWTYLAEAVTTDGYETVLGHANDAEVDAAAEHWRATDRLIRLARPDETSG